MRPGQQNKRGRGRNNNNNNNNNNSNNHNNHRKGGNPLTRTYDSSGPDVKIRGTAQHIAEKYSALARDAQSAGDRVMAENYLQHAEHYNRIIAAAQAQMQERFPRDDRADNADRGDDNDRDGYDRDQDDLPRAWINRMKRAIITLGWRFNADRMVMDYTQLSYVPAAGSLSSSMTVIP